MENEDSLIVLSVVMAFLTMSIETINEIQYENMFSIFLALGLLIALIITSFYLGKIKERMRYTGE